MRHERRQHRHHHEATADEERTPTLDHHDDDRIVELMSLPTPFEAQAVADTLRGEGIVATVATGDAEGWAPHLVNLQGHRVMVFASDLARARDLLDETSDGNAR
jgi:hypothetical protein